MRSVKKDVNSPLVGRCEVLGDLESERQSNWHHIRFFYYLFCLQCSASVWHVVDSKTIIVYGHATVNKSDPI